jgi:hypothetical protein
VAIYNISIRTGGRAGRHNVITFLNVYIRSINMRNYMFRSDYNTSSVYHITYVIDASSWRPTVVERETGTRISRRWRGRADRGRIAGRSILRSIDMRRVAVAVRDLLPTCVPVRHAVAARSPRAARHAARWRVVGFSSRAVAADARSDWSRSRCRPLSRDQQQPPGSRPCPPYHCHRQQRLRQRPTAPLAKGVSTTA